MRFLCVEAPLWLCCHFVNKSAGASEGPRIRLGLKARPPAWGSVLGSSCFSSEMLQTIALGAQMVGCPIEMLQKVALGSETLNLLLTKALARANTSRFRVIKLLMNSKRCGAPQARGFKNQVVLANCGSDHFARSRHLGLRLGYSKRETC